MKNIIITLIMLATMVMAENGTDKDGQSYTLTKSSFGGYWLIHKTKYNKVTSRTSIAQDKEALKRELRLAATITKKKGYSYFVVLNRTINNTNGFPINRFKDLSKYLSLKKRNSKYYTNGKISGNKGILNGPRYRLRFKPVSSKASDSYISLWSVSQTLKDTK